MSHLFLFKKKEKKRSKLPPSQRWIDHILKWGKEHPTIREIPEIPLDAWRLVINGEVEKPHELNWDEFIRLEQVTSVSDFHCVETWSVEDQRWEGVRFNTILDLVKPSKKAKYVLFESYDRYTTSLPISELREENVILAHRLNDDPLPKSLGGPMRLVVPNKYAYKSPMWLHKITFSPRDKLGYWEVGAYSNKADPWKNERYTIR